MAQFATDSFTGTSGIELSTYSASWVRHAGSISGVNIVLTDANRCRSNGPGGVIYYHTGSPASADYSVSVDIYEASDPVGFGLGVTARTDVTAATFYMARHVRESSASVDAWQLYKAVAGSFSQLGSNFTDSITTGTSKTVKLEVAGSSTTSLTLSVNGVSRITHSDITTPITAAGKAGMRHGYGASDTPTNSTIYHADNFSADEGGVAVNLSGTSAATATAIAALSVSIPLAGASLSTATATGGLSLSLPLAGAATATATATGGLSLSLPLAGAATATATATGAIALNITLSGAAIAEAVAAAGLDVQSAGAVNLAGDALAESSATGALSLAIPLSGASLVVTSADGSLSQIVPLAGAAVSVSLATGGLDVSAALSTLAAEALSEASADATLTLRVNLDGAALVNAIAAGALAGTGVLTGTAGYSINGRTRTWRITA